MTAPITYASPLVEQPLSNRKRKTPAEESINQVAIKASKTTPEATQEPFQIRSLKPLMDNFLKDCLAPMKKELLETKQALESIAEVLEKNFNIPKEKGFMLQSLTIEERSSLEKVDVYDYISYLSLRYFVNLDTACIFENELALRIGDKSLLQCKLSGCWLNDAVIVIPNPKMEHADYAPYQASAHHFGKFLRGKEILDIPSAIIPTEVSQILANSKLIPDYTTSGIAQLVFNDIKQGGTFTQERQEAFKEKLGEALIDPVDYVELLKDTKTFDCGHSLSDHNVRNLVPKAIQWDSNGEVVTTSTCCPNCREPFGRENMTFNAHVDKLVEKVKSLNYDTEKARIIEALKAERRPNFEFFVKVEKYYQAIFDAWEKLNLLTFDANLKFGHLHQSLIGKYKDKKQQYEALKTFQEGISKGIGLK